MHSWGMNTFMLDDKMSIIKGFRTEGVLDLHQNRVYSGVRLYRVYMYDHEHEMGLKETSARMSMPCLRH